MIRPVLQVLEAAYLAQAAIERMHDLSTLDPATQALNAYARVLMVTQPEDQEIVVKIRDDQGKPVPSLTGLHVSYLTALGDLYARYHNVRPIAA